MTGPAYLQSSDPRVHVGRFTYGAPRLLLWTEADAIEIGAFCSIAEDVTIFGGGEHNTDWVTTYPLRIALDDPSAWQDGHPRPVSRSTRIGNDVWLGLGATVLAGAQVGDGAVIGARAVVKADVPPYCVVVGNPARVVRRRFTDAQIDALLRIRWWDWPIERIREHVAPLSTNRIDDFIAAARKFATGHAPDDTTGRQGK